MKLASAAMMPVLWGCVLITFLSAVPGRAASESVRIVTAQIPPFGFVTKEQQDTGLAYEISNSIAKEAGLTSTNQILPFARMIEELRNGKMDFGIFLVSKENEEVALKVAPVFPMENIIVGKKGTEFTNLKSLHGKCVAIIRGAKYDDAFTADAAIEKYETVDYRQSIAMLMKGRVDAMIGPSMGLFFAARQMKYSRQDFGKPLVLNTKYTWLQYSKAAADQKKIAALKAAAEKLQQDGTIQRLVEKYR